MRDRGVGSARRGGLDEAGLFDALAHRLARAGRGRVLPRYLLFSAACVVCTILLSLDATVVLLTPIGIRLARRTGVSALPFAMASLWFAHTASLLLPVSNLTNLLAQRSLGWDAVTFLVHTAGAQTAAIVVTLIALGLVFAPTLRSRIRTATAEHVQGPQGSRALPAAAGAAVAGYAAAILVGVPAWAAAAGLAVLLAALLRSRARIVRPPWTMVLFAAALFVVVESMAPRIAPWVQVLVGDGPEGTDGAASRTLAALQASSAGALAANAVNNLPAYLLLEPAVGGTRTMIALLMGVNMGALVAPWGPLATLLWLRTCRAEGLRISLPRLVTGNAAFVVVLLVTSAVAAAALG